MGSESPRSNISSLTIVADMASQHVQSTLALLMAAMVAVVVVMMMMMTMMRSTLHLPPLHPARLCHVALRQLPTWQGYDEPRVAAESP